MRLGFSSGILSIAILFPVICSGNDGGLIRLFPNPLRRFELKSYCKLTPNKSNFGVVIRGRFMKAARARRVIRGSGKVFRRNIRIGHRLCAKFTPDKSPIVDQSPVTLDGTPTPTNSPTTTPTSNLDRNLASTCNEIRLSGDEVRNDSIEVILRPNTFFDTDGENQYQNKELFEIIKEHSSSIPSNLKKKEGLTDHERALQLQSVIELSNILEVESSLGTIPRTKVRILLNPCGYDFSEVARTGDVGGDVELNRLLPKMVFRRGSITMEGMRGHTKIYYSGPSSLPGVNCGAEYGPCHSRVLLVVYRGLRDIEIRGISFEGDMTGEDFFTPERHLHENYGALTHSKGRYAMVMIGYPITSAATQNGVLVEDCTFTGVNMRAIEVHGNGIFRGNLFVGKLPHPQGPPSGEYLNSLSCFANSAQSFCPPGMRGLPRSVFGMNWHSGLSLYGVGTGPTEVTDNEFQNLVEGIVGKHLAEFSSVTGNSFDLMADHAIYLMGSIFRSDISRNYFSRVLSQVVKLGAHSTREAPELVSGDLGPYGSTFYDNVFSKIRGSAFFVSGSFNKFRRNQILDDVDPSGWFNREWIINGDVSRNPFFWITTYGGNTNSSICGYFNHAAGNEISDNVASITDIFIQQMDDSSWASCEAVQLKSDRSIDATKVSGISLVYQRARQNSAFSAGLTLDDGAEIQIEKYPPACGGCARMVLN